MPTKITDAAQLDLNAISPGQATGILRGLKAQLTDSKGAPKSGTLNIVQRNGQWEIRRQSAWSRFWNWGFQKSLGPAQTAECLRDLATLASRDGDLNPENSEWLKGFFRVEPGSVEAKSLHPYLKTALAENRGDLHTNGYLHPKTDSYILDHFGVKNPDRYSSLRDFVDRNRTHGGNMGAIAPLSDTRLLKLEGKPVKVETGPRATLRKRELSAAYLHSLKTGRDIHGVVQPSHLIFEDKKGQHFLVRTQHVKAFLRALPPDADLAYIGQVMPQIPGRNLLEALRDRDPESRPTEADRKEIARQMHGILRDLAGRGFVHHDLKPENFIWDAKKRKLTLIDNGGLLKMSKDPRKGETTSARAGTYANVSPIVMAGAPHSSPVDAFSAGMTLLQIAHEDGPLHDFLNSNDRGKKRIEDAYASEDNYLHDWFTSEDATVELEDDVREGFLDRIGGPDSEIPTLENYAHHLILASFLPQDEYLERMTALENHPYLRESDRQPPQGGAAGLGFGPGDRAPGEIDP
jgi:hypothetical protein